MKNRTRQFLPALILLLSLWSGVGAYAQITPSQDAFSFIAMFVPLLNLIVLILVNQEATGLLRKNGIRVGLMGASLADLPAP